jgi:hypothetical protein
MDLLARSGTVLLRASETLGERIILSGVSSSLMPPRPPTLWRNYFPLKRGEAQMDILAIVQDGALKLYPGVRLQLVPVGFYPDLQISLDLLASQEPPEGQRLSEAFGPPKTMPGRDFHHAGNGASARQEKLFGIFIQVLVERMEIGQEGVDRPETKTSHPQGHQGQCQ